MSRIISLAPVTLTITIRPKPDGTAQVETRAEPEHVDLLVLCQAMLGVLTTYLQQIQSRNQMLVGQKKLEEEDDGA